MTKSKKINIPFYWVLALISLLICNSSYAQTETISTIEPERPLTKGWEDWLDNRPVTGGGDVRVGLVGNNKEVDINDPSSFFVLLPKSAVDSLNWLHVIIKSLDGKYQAKKLFYNIDKVSSRIVRLKVPTRFRKQLSKYKTSELSILTMLKETRNSHDAKHYLASSWKRNFNNNEFVLNVNSRTPIKLITTRKKKKVQDLKCVEVKNDKKQKVSFNFRCFIQRKHINDSTVIMLVKSRGQMKGLPRNLIVPIILE